MGIVLICIVLVHLALARLSGWLCTCPAAYTGTAELEFGLDLACAQLALQPWRYLHLHGFVDGLALAWLAAYTGTAELEFGLDLACAQLAQRPWCCM